MTASTDPDAKKVLDHQDAEQQRKALAPSLSMAPWRYTKTLHFVRHGQGFHNVAGHIDHENYKSEEYADAHLTELGWQQAESLGRHVRAINLPVDLVVVAPLTRALETAVAAFGSHQEPWRCQPEQLLMVPQESAEGKKAAHAAISSSGCPPFLAYELCREHLGVHPCDRRSATSTYRARFPAVDFSLIATEQDVQWTLEHRETKAEIRARGLAFLQWVMARPEQHIAVVTHSSFLHFTMSCFGHDAATHVQDDLHRWYDNCEMRTVVLQGADAPPRPDHWHFAGGAHTAA